VLVLGLMPPPNASSVLVLGLMPPPNASSVQDDPAAVVGMTNMLKYTPDTVRVQAGETVRWENSSLIMHTVTADPGEATLDGSVQLPDAAEPFDSGNLDPDETFEYTFETPGTYQYFCIPHEGAKMYGWVIVAP
jgi:plastocyanin